MAKVHYEIIKRIPRTDVTGVNMGGTGGKVEFTGSGASARITDPALARDIRQSIGQDGKGDPYVLVAEVPDRGKQITSHGFGDGKWDEIRAEKTKPNERIKHEHSI